MLKQQIEKLRLRAAEHNGSNTFFENKFENTNQQLRNTSLNRADFTSNNNNNINNNDNNNNLSTTNKIKIVYSPMLQRKQINTQEADQDEEL
jgi:hypothetical protein